MKLYKYIFSLLFTILSIQVSGNELKNNNKIEQKKYIDKNKK